jgi:SpoIID/LytB domain protein
VLGEALYYNGSYALTMFYASSGGITANCSDVFTVDIPYLRSVASVYDSTYDPHYGTVIYYTVDELRTKLQNAYGIKLSSNPENWITIVEGNGGYANKVIIDGQITVRGNSFRSTMGFKSPKFTYICSVSNETEAAAEETTPVSSSTSSAKTEPTTEAAAPSVTETEAAATEATVASEAEIDNAAVSAQSENEDSLE